MEITELARQHTELVLILPCQHRGQESVGRETGAEVLERSQVARRYSVAGQSQLGVDGSSHSGHDGERESELAAMRQHRLLDQLRAVVSTGKAKSGGSDTMT